MARMSTLLCFAIPFVTPVLAAAQVEVLYVSGPQAATVPLDTYNVDPETALATRVGSMTVAGSGVDPVTAGSQHLIYV
jgi:hypothetical protein